MIWRLFLVLCVVPCLLVGCQQHAPAGVPGALPGSQAFVDARADLSRLAARVPQAWKATWTETTSSSLGNGTTIMSAFYRGQEARFDTHLQDFEERDYKLATKNVVCQRQSLNATPGAWVCWGGLANASAIDNSFARDIILSGLHTIVDNATATRVRAISTGTLV